MRRILFLALILAAAFDGLAQNCAQTLRLARSTYDQGRLHELPALMKDCLDPKKTDGFTKQEKVEAYKLLTMSYIYLEEPEKADSSMLLLLRTDPYFEPNPNVDPQEFLGLYKTFRTRPVFRVGIKFALNSSQPNVSAFNPISDGNASYSPGIGIGGGFIAELPISEKITINGEMLFVQRKFSNNSISTFPTGTGLVEFSNSTGIENQSWLSIPITAQYRIVKKRFEPYVELGVSGDLLLNSTIQGEQRRVSNQSIDSKSFELSSQREKVNISAVLGAGAKTRFASGYLFANVRYCYGLTKVNSPNSLYNSEDLLFDYKLIDGIFSINSVFFNVGYVQNFFNPKKIKRKRISSIRKK